MTLAHLELFSEEPLRLFLIAPKSHVAVLNIVTLHVSRLNKTDTSLYLAPMNNLVDGG